jgi:hypothetical protein
MTFKTVTAAAEHSFTLLLRSRGPLTILFVFSIILKILIVILLVVILVIVFKLVFSKGFII